MSGTLDAARYARLRTFVIAWTIVCLMAGAVAAQQTLRLQDGADAIDGAARGLESTASSLRELKELPLVGGPVADAADSVDRGAGTARASSAEVRLTVRVLALLLGLAVAALPTVPLIALTYLLRPG